MSNSMGMIQLDGITYRIMHLGRNSYEVVRLLDDVTLGVFRRERACLTSSFIAGEHSLRAIARVAVRQGKTKWYAAAQPHGATALPSNAWRQARPSSR